MNKPNSYPPVASAAGTGGNAVELGRAMSDLARALSASRKIDDRLTLITATAEKLVPGADCADILFASTRGRFESRAATTGLPTGLVGVQQKLGEGPCLHAARNHPIVRCDNLRTDTRWPQFAHAAVEAGINAMLSFQLYTGTENVGALNLYGFRAHAFSVGSDGVDPVEVGGILSTHASVAVVSARKEAQLQTALTSRDIIGQAKGMIMERFDVDAARAFELLSKLSQDTNTPVHVVATQLVRRQSLPAAIALQ